MNVFFSVPAAIAAALVLLPLFAGFGLGIDELRSGWRVAALAIATLVLVFREELAFRDDRLTRIAAGAVIAVAAGAGLQAVYAGWWNHLNPHEYDFFALYMDARVAWLRQDFYEPANYQALYAAINPPFPEMHPGFKRNVLEVGTKYPPPSMLYLMPFGALEVKAAHIAWVIVSWIAVAASIGLLWRTVLGSRSVAVLVALAAFVLATPGTRLTLSLEQMHFTALVFALLAMGTRYRPTAGFWIALGTIIKPPVGALALYLLKARQWSGIAVLAAATMVLCGLSIIVYGWDVFLRFFLDNPNLRVSDSLFFEDMNRSLSGTVVRLFGWDFDRGAPMGHPVFLTAAAIITAITAAGVWLSRDRRDVQVLALLLCFGLLLYPGTQRHYAVLLMLPLLITMVTADRDGLPRSLIAVFVFGVAVTSVSHTLWATGVVWLALLMLIAMRRNARS